jgi:putative endonuclease
MSEKIWYVYIIKTNKDTFYTGITTDLKRRFNEHSSGKKGAKFFRSSSPESIVFTKKCLNRSEASKLEIRIKKLNHNKKLQLIQEELYD